MLRDARLRFDCNSRVHRLDGCERRHRTVDHGVTDGPFVLQDLDASLLLVSSLLDVSLRNHGLRGSQSCTMIWLNLMNFCLISTFLEVTISGTPEFAGQFHVPDVLTCSLVKVLKVRRNLLWQDFSGCCVDVHDREVRRGGWPDRDRRR